jgi:hypothetical protein
MALFLMIPPHYRFIGGKVFVGHVASSISVYHKDECELIQLHMYICTCMHNII